MRMGPRLRFRFALPESLEGFQVPPMLLQPLVENAIKHGIEPKVGASEVSVEARRHDDAVEIRVTDTGLGLRGENPGYGLTHVRERIQAFYGPTATLALEPNAPQGALAILRMPA